MYRIFSNNHRICIVIYDIRYKIYDIRVRSFRISYTLLWSVQYIITHSTHRRSVYKVKTTKFFLISTLRLMMAYGLGRNIALLPTSFNLSTSRPTH